MVTLERDGNYMDFQYCDWESDNGFKEILADNYYALEINTILFGILVNHVEEDYVQFCIEDFEKMRRRFINIGRLLIHNAFTYQELLDFLSNTLYFTDVGNHKYIADMKKILGNCNFTDEEKEFFHNNMRYLKIFALFCRLKLDIRLTSDELTVKLLRLQKFI